MSCSTIRQKVLIEALDTLGENLFLGLKEEVLIAASLSWENKWFSYICQKHLNKSTFEPKTVIPLHRTNDRPLDKRFIWSLVSSIDEILITMSWTGRCPVLVWLPAPPVDWNRCRVKSLDADMQFLFVTHTESFMKQSMEAKSVPVLCFRVFLWFHFFLQFRYMLNDQ